MKIAKILKIIVWGLLTCAILFITIDRAFFSNNKYSLLQAILALVYVYSLMGSTLYLEFSKNQKKEKNNVIFLMIALVVMMAYHVYLKPLR